MKIYENIYIGSFIYQLGIEVGKRNLEDMSSLNLFQQTPSDSILSDLITSVNNRFMIIEFKRDNDIDNKELNKFFELFEELEEEYESYDEELFEISLLCHYIGIGETQREKAEINFYRYLTNFTENRDEILNDFISQFLSPSNIELGVTANEFKKYIMFLQAIYEKESTSTGGIIISKNDEGIIMIPTENIQELVLNIDNSFEEIKEKELLDIICSSPTRSENRNNNM